MKYGRNQINKAGEVLMTSQDKEEVQRALEKINDWRMLHLPALDALQNEVMSMLNEIPVFFSSRRIKRLSSIQYKLDINPDMRLGGMQDIGGLRIVFEGIEDLQKARAILDSQVPTSFELVKPMDYINSPKESGYRGIHYIYRYHSENQDLDGMRLELQIRTRLQHYWAMAVETAELVTNTRLKSSFGSDEWLDFFKIVSSLFAIKEGTPILQKHLDDGEDSRSLMVSLYRANHEHMFCDTLKALKTSISFAQNRNRFEDGYYILKIDFETKRVRVYTFSNNNEQQAMDNYSVLEQELVEGKDAMVLVSVPKMKELWEAYPSYFLNTQEFIGLIETIIDNCQTRGYLGS